MVRPGDAIRTQKRFNRVFIAGRMFHHFATGANALVRLNMGAGGHFLQKTWTDLLHFLHLKVRIRAGLFMINQFKIKIAGAKMIDCASK